LGAGDYAATAGDQDNIANSSDFGVQLHKIPTLRFRTCSRLAELEASRQTFCRRLDSGVGFTIGPALLIGADSVLIRVISQDHPYRRGDREVQPKIKSHRVQRVANLATVKALPRRVLCWTGLPPMILSWLSSASAVMRSAYSGDCYFSRCRAGGRTRIRRQIGQNLGSTYS